MKKKIFSMLLFFSSLTFAQIDISTGMGLNFFSAPDLRDYINSNFVSSDELGSFNTSADFFGEIGYNIVQNDQKRYYQIAVEYTFNIYSFNSNFVSGIYDLQVNQHKPSLIGYYVFAGEGYKLKLGGGIGLRMAQIDEKLYGTTENYSTNGFGFLAKAQGDTKLGSDFYALIAGEIRYDIPGEIETLNKGKFNLNAFGVVLKLGISYHL